MQRNVIIFGGGGQLGVELCHEFERRSWVVKRFDRQSVDITNGPDGVKQRRRLPLGAQSMSEESPLGVSLGGGQTRTGVPPAIGMAMITRYDVSDLVDSNARL